MRDTFEQSLRVLGLAPGATEQAIKEAYRDLVKVWHPDRFGSDARLRAKAQDKLKELNAAFEQLRGYRPRDSGPSREHETAPPVDVPQPAVGYRAKDGPTGALLPLLFLAVLAGIVGAWLFISGRYAAQLPFPANEVVTPAPASPTRVPAAPHPARRGAAEPLSTADASAPIGVWQPPPSAATRARSAFMAALAAGSSMRPAVRRASSSSSRISMATMPCPGAGMQPSTGTVSEILETKPRRRSPAAASTIAS